MGYRGFPARAAVGVAAVVVGLAATAVATSVGSSAPAPESADQLLLASRQAGTVASLRLARWAPLPHSPLGGRAGAALAWTGNQLLVVGGVSLGSGRSPVATAAAYTPASGRWTKLRPFPLAARDGSATVWTRHELVVWGGDAATTKPAASTLAITSGAAFDPVSGRWQVMAPGPLQALPEMAAVADGRGDAFLVGGQLPGAGTAGQNEFVSRQAALFDPVKNAWTSVPPVPAVLGHSLVSVTASRLGRQILVVAAWQHVTRISANGFEITGGTDLFLFDPETRRWHPRSAFPSEVPALGADIEPVGTSTVIAGGTSCLPDESCPYSGISPFAVLAANGHIQVGPVPPVQQRVAASTGSAYVITSGTASSGPSRTERPGDSAIYDPATRRWSLLPSAAAFHPNPESLIWAGTELILWTPHGGFALLHS